VERHLDHFAHDTPDEDWLREVGEKGWVAITHDRNIRRKPNELNAVMQNRVALLVAIGGARSADLARSFVETYSKIQEFLSRHTAPYIAKVYRPTPAEIEKGIKAGRVELWYPRAR